MGDLQHLEANTQHHVLTKDGYHAHEARKQGQPDPAQGNPPQSGTGENIPCVKLQTNESENEKESRSPPPP